MEGGDTAAVVGVESYTRLLPECGPWLLSYRYQTGSPVSLFWVINAAAR